MNYGEEVSYWYFRLNGFFPLVNFVVHRTDNVEYSTDIDILAVRFPHVYEAVGGQPDDWDSELMRHFDDDAIIGVLCQVKTGKYNVNKVFKPEAIRYALPRFGFKPKIEEYADELKSLPKTEFTYNNQKYQIAKILTSNKENQNNSNTGYISIQLANIRKFILNRIRQYDKKKWQDRMFFPSNYLEDLIDRVHNEE